MFSTAPGCGQSGGQRVTRRPGSVGNISTLRRHEPPPWPSSPDTITRAGSRHHRFAASSLAIDFAIGASTRLARGLSGSLRRTCLRFLVSRTPLEAGPERYRAIATDLDVPSGIRLDGRGPRARRRHRLQSRSPLLTTRLYVGRACLGTSGRSGGRDTVAGSGTISWATFPVLDHVKPGSYSRPAG
jgi:hypothetical protein